MPIVLDYNFIIQVPEAGGAAGGIRINTQRHSTGEFERAVRRYAANLLGSATGALAISRVADETFERLFGLLMVVLLVALLVLWTRRKERFHLDAADSRRKTADLPAVLRSGERPVTHGRPISEEHFYDVIDPQQTVNTFF